LTDEKAKLSAEESLHKKQEVQVAAEAKASVEKIVAAEIKYANEQRVKAEKVAAKEEKQIKDVQLQLAKLKDVNHKKNEQVEKELKIKTAKEAKNSADTK
jgi:hypothetical protein